MDRARSPISSFPTSRRVDAGIPDIIDIVVDIGKGRAITLSLSFGLQSQLKERVPSISAQNPDIMEVTPRFELGNEGFADPCLTTWLCHHIRETAFSGRFSVWSGRRGSNSLPRPWQGRALPDELRPRMAPVFQHHGASGRSRTNDTRIFSPLLYQLSYRGKWRPRWGSNPRPPA